MSRTKTAVEQTQAATDRILSNDAADTTPAWELVEEGRYRPRRIRGSFRGRELG